MTNMKSWTTWISRSIKPFGGMWLISFMIAFLYYNFTNTHCVKCKRFCFLHSTPTCSSHPLSFLNSLHPIFNVFVSLECDESNRKKIEDENYLLYESYALDLLTFHSHLLQEKKFNLLSVCIVVPFFDSSRYIGAIT